MTAKVPSALVIIFCIASVSSGIMDTVSGARYPAADKPPLNIPVTNPAAAVMMTEYTDIAVPSQRNPFFHSRLSSASENSAMNT